MGKGSERQPEPWCKGTGVWSLTRSLPSSPRVTLEVSFLPPSLSCRACKNGDAAVTLLESPAVEHRTWAAGDGVSRDWRGPRAAMKPRGRGRALAGAGGRCAPPSARPTSSLSLAVECARDNGGWTGTPRGVRGWGAGQGRGKLPASDPGSAVRGTTAAASPGAAAAAVEPGAVPAARVCVCECACVRGRIQSGEGAEGPRCRKACEGNGCRGREGGRTDGRPRP